MRDSFGKDRKSTPQIPPETVEIAYIGHLYYSCALIEATFWPKCQFQPWPQQQCTNLFSLNTQVCFPLLCCNSVPCAFKPFCILKVPPCLLQWQLDVTACSEKVFSTASLAVFTSPAPFVVKTAVFSTYIFNVPSLFPSPPPKN